MTDPPAPSTIVATIPRWLDRPPRAGETVLVGFSPMDDDLAVCLALHPDADPEDDLNAHRLLVTDGAEQVAIVAYTGHESPLLEVSLRFHAACAARYGLDVLGVLVAVPPQRDRPGYWRSVGDDSSTAIHPIIPTPTEEPR